MFTYNYDSYFCKWLLLKQQQNLFGYFIHTKATFEQLYRHLRTLLFVTTEEGVVSSTTNTIRGATYRRYGEIQYISLPRSSNQSQTLTLNGYSEGSFTLEVEEWGENTMSARHTYAGIPSGTSTEVRMTISGGAPIDEVVL